MTPMPPTPTVVPATAASAPIVSAAPAINRFVIAPQRAAGIYQQGETIQWLVKDQANTAAPASSILRMCRELGGPVESHLMPLTTHGEGHEKYNQRQEAWLQAFQSHLPAPFLLRNDGYPGQLA